MEKSEKLPYIPGYKVEGRLGRGGMADVYLGVQETLDRKVAIKILNPKMIQNHQLLKRFLNEARTASRLEHPSIVTIHDVGQVENKCFIVMEFLTESLVQRIKSSHNRCIEPFTALHIVKQIAGALDYAHQEGFIHRDIKPDNILFRKDNTPVLVDFGIARAVDSDSHLTTVGMIIGTPHYMSPEQCRGEKIDGQSDLYSLGIVLYEMLTGDIPYRADSAAGILVKHIQEPIPQLTGLLRRYQPLLDKMMAKDKSRRISTGAELIRHLKNYLPETPLDTIEVSSPERWVFQETVISSDEKPRISIPGEDITSLTPVPTPKNKHSMLWLLLVLLLVVGGGTAYYYLGYLPSKTQNMANQEFQGQQKGEVNVDEREILTPENKGTPPQSNTTAHRENTAEKTNQSEQEQPKTLTPGESTNAGTPNSTNMQTQKDNEFQKLYSMAEEYFNDGEVQKAQEKIDEAKKIKQSNQLIALQKKIDAHRIEEKRKQYDLYYDKANNYYKKGNFPEARENIKLARKAWGQNTEQLSGLEKAVKNKEEAQRRRAERIRLQKKRDDDAFDRARSSNKIWSYEKYLEKHSKGRHAEEAQRRLDNLKSATQLESKIKDDVAFETASSQNTVPAFTEYIKQFPYGLHVKEAEAKIEQLKQQLIKNTKIKIDVQKISFYEAGSKPQSAGARKYAVQFQKASTRFIYTEISYKHKLFRVAASKSRVKIEYSHNAIDFKHRINGEIQAVKEVQDGLYAKGMGWKEPGKWPLGTYTVTIYIEDTQVGKATFEIK
jgi:serine/threonine protein kinase